MENSEVTQQTQQPAPAAPAAPAAQSVEPSAQPENPPEPRAPESEVETETPQRRESRRQRQLNRERNARIAAETEARLLRERIERLEAGGKQQPKTDGVDHDAPKREQFDSYEEFIRAEARYYARKEARDAAKAEREEHTKSDKERRDRESSDKLSRQWMEKLEDARDDLEDFDDVTAASDAVITPAMAYAIQESDKGGHIAYHLAKNPQEAERISKLSPSKQAAAIVALEEKVAKPAKQPSKAPEPINPVGKKGAEVDKDPAQMSDSEYAAYRKKRRAAKGLT